MTPSVFREYAQTFDGVLVPRFVRRWFLADEVALLRKTLNLDVRDDGKIPIFPEATHSYHRQRFSRRFMSGPEMWQFPTNFLLPWLVGSVLGLVAFISVETLLLNGLSAIFTAYTALVTLRLYVGSSTFAKAMQTGDPAVQLALLDLRLQEYKALK